ncbi:MAG: PQQ-binding-like beta-propeller repeat protein [Rhodothermales bacterium]
MPHSGIRYLSYCAVLLVLLAGARPAAAQDNTLWPGFRHDNQRTGRSPLAGPSFPDALWQRDLRGYAYASPAFGPGGIIYAASERRLYAYDRGGTLQWSYDFLDVVPATIDIRGIVSSPAVTPAGVVYIGSLDEYLYSIDANGNLRWRVDTGGQIFSSPVYDNGAGRVFVGSRSGSLFAFNADGTSAWTPFSTTGEIFASPALGADGSLFFGSTDGGLYGLNSATGALLWTPFTVGSEFVSSPVIGSDGTVYAGSLNDVLYAVNGTTGRQIWNYDTRGDIVSSPALGANGVIYVATLDGALHAVDAATGQARWTQPFQASDRVASSPAIGLDGLIYFGALDGTFYAIEDTGSAPSVAWTYNAGTPVWSSPAIGTGETLYFVSAGLNNDRGLLHAIGPSAFDVRFQGVPSAGQDALMTINQAGTNLAAAGTIFYRRAGDLTFASQPFAGQATIPGASVTESGLEYYIVDDEGAVYPTNTPQQRPASQTVRVASASPPYDLIPRTYKMVAVPLLLDDTSLADVLGDDYGDYDPQAWRLLRWKDDAFVEFPTLDDPVRPGEAFFLITRDGAPFDAEAGFSVPTGLPYPITLQPGWNMVGNPFAFPVAWADVDRDAGVVNAIAYFNGVEMVQDPAAIGTLLPWEGYFVFNAGDTPVTIAIPPIPAPAEAQPEGETTAFARITAAIPGRSGIDSQNWIGTSDAPFAMPEAPAFTPDVTLSLLERDEAVAVSARPDGASGQVWSMRLRAPADAESAELRFAGLREAFGQEAIYLIDDDYGYARPIEDGTTRIALSTDLPERRLRLAVGGTLDAVLGDAVLAPERTALLPNYPNPFSGSTTIAYELAEPAEVDLTVYNALGQAVGTVVRGWQTPGRYAIDWTSDRAPASGVYLYRLRAGSFTSTGKMIVVK